MTRLQIEVLIEEAMRVEGRFIGPEWRCVFNAVMAAVDALLPRIVALETYEHARGIAAAAVRKAEVKNQVGEEAGS